MDNSDSDGEPAPQAPAVNARNGILFAAPSFDTDAVIPKRRQVSGDGIFPVRKASAKKQRKGKVESAHASGASSSSAAPTAPKSANAAPTATASAVSAVCGTAPNPHQIHRQEGERGTELLDDRVCPDLDETYGSNEKALTEFIRLHPMLSLDSTSEKMLSKVSDMMGNAAIPVREVEVVSKTHDDLFLRPCNPNVGERPCTNNEKCVCRWIAAFRYGEDTDNAFVCREYLLPSQQAEFEATGDLPKTQGKCLICQRYFTTHLYHLARNNPNFCPRSNIDVQVFQNKIACEDPLSNAPHHASSIGTDDGYSSSKMLFVDERWVDSSSSRNEMSTLLWKPTVRFNSADYHFFIDQDGMPRCIQQNMSTPSQLFGGAPS